MKWGTGNREQGTGNRALAGGLIVGALLIAGLLWWGGQQTAESRPLYQATSTRPVISFCATYPAPTPLPITIPKAGSTQNKYWYHTVGLPGNVTDITTTLTISGELSYMVAQVGPVSDWGIPFTLDEGDCYDLGGCYDIVDFVTNNRGTEPISNCTSNCTGLHEPYEDFTLGTDADSEQWFARFDNIGGAPTDMVVQAYNLEICTEATATASITPTPSNTPTPTATSTRHQWQINFNNSPTPTVTGTPPTAAPTATGTPPTATPTATPRPYAILRVYGSGDGFPTYTPAPTAAITPTPTKTPTGTPDADVVINEVCAWPNSVDLNLDGSTDTNDRAVELYSPESANVDLGDWTFVISDTTTLYTYTVPLSATIFTQSYKILWGSDLATPVPVTGTFTLNTSWGHVADTYTVSAQSTPGLCDARKPDAGTPTTNTAQTLGRANPTP